ncbi:MAG: FAD-binding oxidoreductase [Hyphomicrobiales bacterium]|nr:FAD-binding oxidoreductase [Hyphomicrobiales bacterium]MDE2114832.1 FAD-binding oxidoreductase [Hyphomicrobiales bacterium]
MTSKFDVIVLGAGIVGLGAAMHLQQSGKGVALVDKNDHVGRETSYGNAGLIERASIKPYMLPWEVGKLMQYALNLSPAAHYQLRALPSIAPWILRYARNSMPANTAKIAAAARPLIEHSLSEHEALMEKAGAQNLLRRTGWIKFHRSETEFAKAVASVDELRGYGLTIDILSRAELMLREPFLNAGIGALHYKDPGFVPDPAALSQAYANYFTSLGGTLHMGDARSLSQTRDGWQLTTEGGNITAREVVVALGPWSTQILAPLGYNIPLGVKRGYHMHFGVRGNAVLNHPVLDNEMGYLLAPMNQGIRLTTGAEFASFDAPPSPVQLAEVTPIARDAFPLAEPLDPTPWMGRRPCLPDMLPIIGRAPRHPGLWLDFGHQHHGLTLSAVSGRLLTEMMTGQTPFTNPAPYSIARFG